MELKRHDKLRVLISVIIILVSFLNFHDSIITGANIEEYLFYTGSIFVFGIICYFVQSKYIFASLLLLIGLITIYQYPTDEANPSWGIVIVIIGLYYVNKPIVDWVIYFVTFAIVILTMTINKHTPSDNLTVFIGYLFAFVLYHISWSGNGYAE